MYLEEERKVSNILSKRQRADEQMEKVMAARRKAHEIKREARSIGAAMRWDDVERRKRIVDTNRMHSVEKMQANADHVNKLVSDREKVRELQKSVSITMSQQ